MFSIVNTNYIITNCAGVKSLEILTKEVERQILNLEKSKGF